MTEQGLPGLAQYIPSNPADWPVRPRTVQDALDFLAQAGGAVGNATSFVWRPGGVAAPGVYTTWANLAAAFADFDPSVLKLVSVDDSIAAAHITTGAWANCDNIWFFSAGSDSGNAAIATIIVDQGASFTGNPAHLRLSEIAMTYSATSGALISTTAGHNFFLQLDAAQLIGSGLGGQGIISCGGTLSLVSRVSAISGTGPVIGAPATGSVFVEAFNATTIAAGTIVLTAGASMIFILDGSSQAAVSTAQTPVPTTRVADPLPMFVFQPGGTAGGNTFITWATLMAAVALTPGRKFIRCDDSLAAMHVTTVGAGAPWNIDDCVFAPNFNATATLIFDAGAKVTFTQIWLQGGIIFQQPAAATGPVFAQAGGGSFAAINLEGDATNISALGAQPWATTLGNLVVMLSNNSSIGDGAHNAINALAGGTVVVNEDGSVAGPGGTQIALHAFGGAGTLDVIYTEGSGFPPTQDTTTQALSYAGFNNSAQQTGNTGTGTHTVTVTTAAIAKKKTGAILVLGSMAGATAAADTITATLVRDVGGANTTIATQTVTTTAGQLNYNVSFAFLDTAPDAAGHTYSIRLAGAQNNTVAAGQGIITAVEQ